MDDLVKAALIKWPNVPACYGWLGLDARGDWYLRDAPTQASGPFPQVKGSRITHDKLKAFVQRNYLSDAHGAWYFQNGPQRVYVELEAAPWVMGIARQPSGFQVLTHTEQAVTRVLGTYLDELGRLFLDTPEGFGIVRSLDMEAACDALEAGCWPSLEEVRFAELPQRFAYQLHPE